ncbi:YczE/YyaS/YitT family protein [Shewanella sp.]|uniref:YczE/YyaS/YitT family protein n=1 Tax=Shewanella sp. TaxID=50422 RepID=UPI003A98633B
MKQISRHHLLNKITLFVIGLFIMAIGVALSIKANLGVSPISCVPYVLSLHFALSIGELTIIFNSFIVLLQILLLRRRYRPLQLLQIIAASFFGYFIDCSMLLLQQLQPDNYFWQLFTCVASCAVLAFGVFFIVKANLTYLPGEGLAVAITDLLQTEFGKVKISIDSAMVLCGVLTALLLFGELLGIREGTIIAALLVGYLVKQFVIRFHFVDRYFPVSDEPTKTTAPAAKIHKATEQ